MQRNGHVDGCEWHNGDNPKEHAERCIKWQESQKCIETFIMKRYDEQWKERLNSNGKEWCAGYEEALLDVRDFIRKLHEKN